METVPVEWQEAANQAADKLGLAWGVPILTQAEADEFSELGQPDMQRMVGRPVGITPGQYRDFLRRGNSGGPDLNFMLRLIRGDHLDKDFLRHAS